jgi:hypothetical protein
MYVLYVIMYALSGNMCMLNTSYTYITQICVLPMLRRPHMRNQVHFMNDRCRTHDTLQTSLATVLGMLRQTLLY